MFDCGVQCDSVDSPVDLAETKKSKDKKKKVMLELTEEQKIFEKLYSDLFQVITKAGFKHVEHGDKFIFASSDYKNKKIELKILIK